MTHQNPGRRTGLLAPAAAGVLLLLALAGCGTASTAAGPAPSAEALSPPASSPPGAPADSSRQAVPAAPAPVLPAAAAPRAPDAPQLPPVLAASAPVTLEIPSIGVRTDLLHLGLRPNGSLEVPGTDAGAPASWYNGSPTPGERGPAVMLGHVNADGGGKGVFADLRRLTPGTEINVSRTDGSMAVFTVDRGALYSKNEFPTHEVYGNTDRAELRLITCDGYDPATGLFDDNYVIYATLKT